MWTSGTVLIRRISGLVVLVKYGELGGLGGVSGLIGPG